MKPWKTVPLAFLACALAAGAQAQVSDDVVKIAVLDDMSSVYADLTGPGGVAAVRMAIEDFGGKVLGKPVELVFADHQNKADVAAAAGRQWYDVDKVDMITGLGNSAVALAIQQLAREKNRINIVSGAASTDLTGKSCSPTPPAPLGPAHRQGRRGLARHGQPHPQPFRSLG